MIKLRTVPQAAKESGIFYPTLLRLIREEKVRVVVLPGRKKALVDMADIDAFIAGAKSGLTGGQTEEIEPAQTVDNWPQPEQGQKTQKQGNVHWMQRRATK